MYEFLKKFFEANEDGTTVPMTFEQLEEKINADSNIKIVDLSAGGYVDKQKHDRIAEELKGTKEQLTTANEQIQQFKDMDIEGIKKASEEYKVQSEASIKELQDKLDAQDMLFSAKEFLRGFEFSSEFAMESVLNKFMEQGFKKDENGKFLGADDYMKGLQESHPDAFKQAEEPKAEPQNQPFFSPNGGSQPPEAGAKKWTLEEVMAYANENPNTNIDALLDKM